MERIHAQAAPGNGSALVTAGDLLFWGDLDRRFNAFDADTGEILWTTVVGGIVQTSTISYAVDGRQYVAVPTGAGGASWAGSIPSQLIPEKRRPLGGNGLFVFALPE